MAVDRIKAAKDSLRAVFDSWGSNWYDYGGNTCAVRYWGNWDLPGDCDPDEEDYDWKVLDPDDYNMAKALVKDIANCYNVKIHVSIGEKCYLDFQIEL